MNHKIIVTGKEARAKLAKGADILAQAVTSTLGPRSWNVALNMNYPAPKILHDGVSVAEHIRLKDPFEDMGAVLIKEAASKTNDLAGDGTTTATLLANTLVQEGLKLVEGGMVDGVISGRVNPMVLRDQLLSYSEQIIAELDKRAKKLTTKKEYQQVATVSSASEEIGKLIADAIEKVGSEGVIMVEESATFDSGLVFREGMEFDNGFLSPYLVTDPDRMICEYKDAYILLTDYTIADPMQLVPLIEKVIKDNNKPLLIVASDVMGPALQALVQTKLRASARLMAVVAPEFADRRKEMLEDIAVLTGANVIASDLGRKLEDVEISDLGRLESFRVDATHTTIIPKYIDTDEIKERIETIRNQIADEKNSFRQGRLKERLTKLSGSIAVINIGGGSQSEVQDMKERAIDAVYATKAAMAEGIIPGGGSTLDEISECLKNLGDAQIFELVRSVLEKPFCVLMQNAGEDEEEVRQLIHVLPDTVKNRGYDLVSKKAGDLMHMGIVDPVKVTKLAIRHSFSVAATFLTTATLVSDDTAEDVIHKIRQV